MSMSGMLTRAGLRAFSTANLKVFNDVAKQQFRLTMRDAAATLKYERNGSNITFISTDVPKEFQGKGAGKVLADYAFKFAHDNKLFVKCQCNFLCDYYKKNSAKYEPLRVSIEPTED